MKRLISRHIAGVCLGLALTVGVGNIARGGIVVNGTVTAPGDLIYGVAATGGSSTSTVSSPNPGAGGGPGTNTYPFPPNGNDENPAHAIDQTTAKYLLFEGTAANIASNVFGGFIVTPSAGPSVLTSVQFTAGNDSSDRDPLTITIEGTNTPIPTGAAAGSTITAAWTPVYSGVSGLATDPGRDTAGPAVTFVAPITGFSSYRLLVTSVRDVNQGCCFQFDEVNLVGSSVPEPGSLSLLGVLGATGLGLLRNRRKVV